MRGMAITSGNIEVASKEQCEKIGKDIMALKDKEFNVYSGSYICEKNTRPK
jgi:hypothetical protein